jgi:hypothetical protein
VERSLKSDTVRLLKVKPGNLSQGHLYITGHYDFFPPECFGPPSKKNKGAGNEIQIVLGGMNETVRTDIGTQPGTGKPRAFFRRQARWLEPFSRNRLVGAVARPSPRKTA